MLGIARSHELLLPGCLNTMTQDNSPVQAVQDLIQSGAGPFEIVGTAASARSYLLSRIIPGIRVPCLVIAPTAAQARRLYRELAFFLPESLSLGSPDERRLYDFPVYDISPLSGLSPHRDVVTRRIQALYALTELSDPVVITSSEAAAVRLMPKPALIGALDYLEEGEEVGRDRLISRLHDCGYMRTSLVEERGDYAVRGGVVDVFPPLMNEPVRFEFWGDHLESIRCFDPLSQRSTSSLKELVLLPASEILLNKDSVERARSMGRLPPEIKEGGGFSGQEAWLNHFYERPGTLFDYLPEKALLFRIDPERINSELIRFRGNFLRDAERYRRDAEEREQPFPEINGLLVEPETAGDRMAKAGPIDFREIPIKEEAPGVQTVVLENVTPVEDSLDLRIEGKGRVSLAPLAERIEGWLEYGSRVVLVSRTEQQAGRLQEILANYRLDTDGIVNCWHEVPPGPGVTLCLGGLSRGFAWPGLGLHVVSEDEIFGPKRSRASRRRQAGMQGLNWTSFSGLQVGDPVVHEDHGIGLYSGLKKMEVAGKANDFVIVEYEGADRLYVPADRISILQKYIGADEKTPKLDRMGGRSWDVAKGRARKSVKEIARQLVEIYALRSYRTGHAFGPPDNAFREFEATFEHEETPDQAKAIDDVLDDLESDRPMDRLICGDVGFGKTEVALRAAFKAVSEGKQVAMLVPTTVLAEQHFETFRRRMEPYGVVVSVLSRFKSRAEQRELAARARSGKVDVLIGTHRLLQKDVGFRDLGLLIVDEEQRFGVKQKEALKKYRALVDVLSLTATPIPRTLHLSLMGVRDLSVIETPPEDRQAIRTYIVPYDEATIVHAVEHELERGGQVFFVHNRVRTIDQITARLREILPKARIGMAHGQMKQGGLENTMMEFLRKEIDVLVCTTIIESGLDIPSVNTIILHQADRFGLAQVYQLRGRVGRSSETAYAYLLLSDTSAMTREAVKRLKALMDFSQLGAGLQLALHDLKIRGGGNILGFSQSGHIAAVGYELYIRLIEEAVSELKGEEWREEINPEIHVNLSAYLPDTYVSDPDVRLNLYRRMSSLKENEELESLRGEIADRFGPPPKEVLNLLHIMSVRLLMKLLRATRMEVTREALVLTFAPDTDADAGSIVKMVESDPGRYSLSSGNRLRVRPASPDPLNSLDEALALLRLLAPKAPR